MAMQRRSTKQADRLMAQVNHQMNAILASILEGAPVRDVITAHRFVGLLISIADDSVAAARRKK